MNPTSIELFTGAGGLAMGISRAGFEHLAVIERDIDACATLRANLPSWPIHETDSREFDFRPYAGKLNLLAAGAPCQPFSLGGKHAAYNDSRDMFPEVFRAVRETMPEIVIVENVKGLLRSGFRDYFDYILLQLAHVSIKRREGETWRAHKTRLERRDANGDLRYEVAYQLVNCADYGVPQIRSRVFVVAFRADLKTRWWELRPTHSEEALFEAKWVTGEYWPEHGVRVPPTPREVARRLRMGRSLLVFGKRWQTVRDALKGLPEPYPLRDYPGIHDHVGNPGARSYPGHTGSELDLPAKTLKAGDHGCPGGENMLRSPDGSVRYFTVREAARLQTFRDSYRFKGAWSECLRQLGNAVPVRMGEVVARAAWNLRRRPARRTAAHSARPMSSA